jgi:hypothetical protein
LIWFVVSVNCIYTLYHITQKPTLPFERIDALLRSGSPLSSLIYILITNFAIRMHIH